MEPYTLLVLATVFVLSIIFLIKRANDRKLPPGPWKLPLIGSMHHLSTKIVPHRSLQSLARKYGPIMHLQLGEISAIVITSPDIARQIMKTHDNVFANRPSLLAPKIVVYNRQDISFSPHGEYWRQMRKLATMELLNASQVQSFRSLRENEVWNLISILQESVGSSVNLSKRVSSMTNAIICRTAVGRRWEDDDELIMLIRENAALAGGFDISDIFPSLKPLHYLSGMRPYLESIHRKVDVIMQSIIAEHEENKGSIQHKDDTGKEDLVQILLKLKETNGLGFPIEYDNIKAVIFDMLAAGTQTSSAVVEWAMSELIRNPKVMEKAQAEVRDTLKGKTRIFESDIEGLDYLRLVIKETLRLHPPVPLLLPRECMNECDIDGYTIPVNTKVIINAWAIGRDPKYWPEPDSFIPERFETKSIDFKGNDFEYIPFGAGRRMCAGMNFGIANVELPLAQILYHFNWKHCNGNNPCDLDMTETFGATAKRKNNLILVPELQFPFHKTG